MVLIVEAQHFLILVFLIKVQEGHLLGLKKILQTKVSQMKDWFDVFFKDIVRGMCQITVVYVKF